jgi:hypothetical protein
MTCNWQRSCSYVRNVSEPSFWLCVLWRIVRPGGSLWVECSFVGGGGIKSEWGAVDGWTYYCVSDLSVTMYDADAMFPIQPPLHTCALGTRRKQTEPTCATVGLKAFIVPRLRERDSNIYIFQNLCVLWLDRMRAIWHNRASFWHGWRVVRHIIPHLSFKSYGLRCDAV